MGSNPILTMLNQFKKLKSRSLYEKKILFNKSTYDDLIIYKKRESHFLEKSFRS